MISWQGSTVVHLGFFDFILTDRAADVKTSSVSSSCRVSVDTAAPGVIIDADAGECASIRGAEADTFSHVLPPQVPSNTSLWVTAAIGSLDGKTQSQKLLLETHLSVSSGVGEVVIDTILVMPLIMTLTPNQCHLLGAVPPPADISDVSVLCEVTGEIKTQLRPQVGKRGKRDILDDFREEPRFGGISGAAVPILGLEHHEANHDRDQADGGYHQGEDDDRRRVAQLLRGTILEEVGVNVHKDLLHQGVGPRDLETSKAWPAHSM
ncbi:hypothetical protein EYF80_032977 [Liparis tanakae]|uniref:Uncharacterized protein n=1 Tax=Liparis tanakae TaxID=230148 RepID=A0A4Z2GTQ1_9TELE|nr:hypothetical protein EYF80_032977 [Liparis tanakae]